MYGNPTFRFTLTHSIQGSQIISEPVGWREAKLKLERHEDYHSLVEYFEGSFTFYGTNGVEDGGLEFIKTVERLYGVDANIDFLVEISFDDGYTFDTVFTGLLDLSDIQETKNNKAEIPIIRNDFWASFINRRETPVDLQSVTDLDGDTRNVIDSIDLDLSSQVVLKRYSGNWTAGERITVSAAGGYFQVTPTNIELDEIDEAFKLFTSFNPDVPVWLMEMDEAGAYNFSFRFSVSGMTAGASTVPIDHFFVLNGSWFMYFQKNDEAPIILNQTDFVLVPATGKGYTLFELTLDVSAIPGDIFRIYGDEQSNLFSFLSIWGTEGAPYFVIADLRTSANLTGLDNPSFIEVDGQTTFPPSTSDTFLLHDAAAAITDRIIGVDNSFYSEYLGSPQTNARQYLSEGCEWEHVLVRGLQLRGYPLSQKQFSMSFKKWWDGANPILNLGLGYDTISGQEVIRVEEKEYFFVPTPSVYIDNIYELMREYDKNLIYKKIDIGYAKWQSEDISGIDDPQTKHTYATRLQKVGTDFKIYSEFIAASLAIEITRRQTIEKSKDYKFDEDVFIIAINGENISPDRYRPELLEDFNFVTNLQNSDTRYNLRLTPARNLLRWIKFLNNGLQSYIGSIYKFTAGEGNYDMTSDMVISTPGCNGDFSGEVLSEKQDILVTDEYVFIPQEFTAEIDLSWEDYKTIRNNPRNAIGISQTESDHVAFYIKSLEYQPVQGKAVFKMWPVVPFYMSTSDYVPVNMVCTEDCVDAITDGVDALTDELGECITA